MRTILVTGCDTGVGKTVVTGAIAKILSEGEARVQVVKVVETGVTQGAEGDAQRARRLAGSGVEAFTLESFQAALAPAAAARLEGRRLLLDELLEKLRALPECDWRICEGAGGIASPIDAGGRDWADFAAEAGVDAAVIVVPDRLGAINQARLACLRASQAVPTHGVWLNATGPVEPEVARSNRDGLRSAGLSVWAEQAHDAELPADPERVRILLSRLSSNAAAPRPDSFSGRIRKELAVRDRKKLRRSLRVSSPGPGVLNLADNDYLELAHDPDVIAAASSAARNGTSASASPLVTGWREEHARLLERLCAWHGFPFGLLWTSGYAANCAVLGALPARGDLVFADRLVHHSMIAGLVRSPVALRRYRHLDLAQLEAWLSEQGGSAATFVVTESVFSMDGDYPDLSRLAELKRRFGFHLVLDEAHALGWYGPEGAGIARAAAAEECVDVLIGTLGKTLAAAGAYSLFRDEAIRDYLVNFAGEFIYSTALPPANAAAARAALERVRVLSRDQERWHAASRAFRTALKNDGWNAPEGESPIVPVRLDDEAAALSLSAALSEAGILAAAVRPPTVPTGTSRMRFSLKRSFGADESGRVIAAMANWRSRR